MADALWLAERIAAADSPRPAEPHSDEPEEGGSSDVPDDPGPAADEPSWPSAGSEASDAPTPGHLPPDVPGRPPPETTATAPSTATGRVRPGGRSGSPPPPGRLRGPGGRRGHRGLAVDPLIRAVRPLRQTVESVHEFRLDEEATAECMAADPAMWTPVCEPEEELRSEVVLVVDAGPTMLIWQETVAQLDELLVRSGSFRSTRVRRLRTDSSIPEDVTLLSSSVPGVGYDPGELIDPTGRRIVLVLTDGLAPAWDSQAVLPLLQRWGRVMPVAVVHLLPSTLWHRSGLDPQRLGLRATSPWQPNSRLDWVSRGIPRDLLDPVAQPVPDGAVPVPVLELDPRWLRAWVGLLVGGRAEWTTMTGVLAGPWKGPRDAARAAPVPEATALEKVLSFRAQATPEAFMLAARLAAAPLRLPVIKRVQERLVPASRASHVSELLMSPLVSASSGEGAPGFAFDFAPGVREELLATARRAETVRVLKTVADAMEECGGGYSPDLVEALTTPGTASAPRVTQSSAPLLRIEQQVMQAMSGQHLSRARQLSELLGDPAAPGGSAPSGVSSGDTAPDRDPDRRSPEKVSRPHGSSGAQFAADRQPSTSLRATGQEAQTNTGGTQVTQTTAEPTAERRYSTGRPAVWGNIPQRNPNFTGREELLAALRERLEAGTTAVLPEALHGMGGVGKSQLAVEYVYRHQADYDVIWWIPSERKAQAAQALVELAQQMRLPVKGEANQAVPALREALRRGEPYERWLLVFDNAESPDTVREFFPQGGSGSILVTSRNLQWGSVARPLEVDVFAREESKSLLRRRDPGLTEEESERLAVALGDLPLAVEQAAAWRAETGMPADEYLRLFEQKRTELLEVSPPLDYQLPVAAAWNVSLDQIELRNPAALQLLQVASFLAPEPVARSLFSSARNASIAPELDAALRDPLRLARAIREINRYSLARIDHRKNSIQMHRLVQAVLLSRMTEEERDTMLRGARALIASGDPNNPESAEAWPRYAELYPHVVASKAEESDDPWVRELVMNTAKYLYRWGEHEEARAFSQRAYETWKRERGEEDESTLVMAQWLGFMLFAVGRYREAAELNAHTLSIYEETVPEDREDALEAIGAVAIDHRVQGDFARALELSETVYTRSMHAFGEDDPTTLNAAHNLAVSLRLAGEFARARDLDDETWQRKVQVFGEDHELSLITRAGLTIDRRELGDYVEARKEQEDSVQKYRQLMGDGHPGTLRAERHLSVALRKAGAHEQARELSDAVTRKFTARYGVEHPDTTAAALNHSVDLRQTGDLAAAKERGQELLERYTGTLGEEHPHTVSTAVNLAITLRLMGELEAALRMDEKALETFRLRLSDDHPSTLVCRTNLASDLYALGEFDRALELDTDTLERSTRVLGESHPSTLAIALNRALDLRALRHTQEAEELHARALAGFQGVLGSDHPATMAASGWMRADCDIDPMPL
ncbi:FxSxx-COOH system tetratricopeptide repeat protein [Wenjunlia tyrosinilytica]|uniref:FxSxx-COOH system tetratricopeptide repeat protein n=1 Tax=Wenjunlia tyrosinilytica TaxID=1544741 RepID=UPI001668D245|nr:FxSxx-COOH system tetratricopeptide repeat protein [Wenjunlia tyrosinilytica]